MPSTSPVSSASGMNEPGRTSPRSGWRQRTQRLDADDSAGSHRHLRLEVEDELVVAQGLAQAALQAEALLRRTGQLVGVELQAAAGLLLGAVHGAGGVVHEGGEVVPVLRADADADAGRDEELVSGEGERGGQRVENPARDRTGAAGVVRFLEQHRELVAAPAADGVVGPHTETKSLGHLAEQLVPGGVAEGVVEMLEPVEVEVEEHHRDAAAGAAGPGQRVFAARSEEKPVGQAGKWIVVGEKL